MFGDFERWFQDMDRMFSHRHEGGVPRVTSSRTPSGYVFHADLPGFEENDVKIDVHNNVLTLTGERNKGEWKEYQARRCERSGLKFTTSLRLPEDVDTDNVSASLKNGVLTVSLAQRPEVKPRQISVKSS
jgi:HSP20 family protein